MVNNIWGSFDEDALEFFYEEYAERLDKSKMKCNDPKATPDHPTKSHVVKACYPGAPEGGKIIRFGQQGVKGSPHKEGESELIARGGKLSRLDMQRTLLGGSPQLRIGQIRGNGLNDLSGWNLLK